MKKVYIETYGCQMNVADTEVVLSVLNNAGYTPTAELEGADLAFMNTCAIRENAEEKIWNRLNHWKKLKKRNPEIVVGVLGCMAEHLRKDLLRDSGNIVDLIVGPDEYRRLPALVSSITGTGDRDPRSGVEVSAAQDFEQRTPDPGSRPPPIAVKLSRTETYDDILPYRNEGISAFISVMRGCDKFCTFCVVPYTRGRERSRNIRSIVEECKELEQQGFREITLLGQNVNSYRDAFAVVGTEGTGGSKVPHPNNLINPSSGRFHDFSDLLAACAKAVPNVRIRYTTSHPQDFDQKLVDTMAEHDNICKYIHLPIQSGSDRILKLMNRTYTRTHYMSIIEMIRKAEQQTPPPAERSGVGGGWGAVSVAPSTSGWSLSTDIIVGFCTETLEDHEMTKEVMREVGYDGAYMFNYSPRPNTRAWSTLEDDVPLEEKTRRLNEIVALQNEISTERNRAEIGREHIVLVEGRSKKNADEWKGRTDTNKMVVFPRIPRGAGVPPAVGQPSSAVPSAAEVGEYRKVKITRSNSATLFGELVDVGGGVAAQHVGLERGEVLYDLTPLITPTIRREESAGMMELPIIDG